MSKEKRFEQTVQRSLEALKRNFPAEVVEVRVADCGEPQYWFEIPTKILTSLEEEYGVDLSTDEQRSEFLQEYRKCLHLFFLCGDIEK